MKVTTDDGVIELEQRGLFASRYSFSTAFVARRDRLGTFSKQSFTSMVGQFRDVKHRELYKAGSGRRVL